MGLCELRALGVLELRMELWLWVSINWVTCQPRIMCVFVCVYACAYVCVHVPLNGISTKCFTHVCCLHGLTWFENFTMYFYGEIEYKTCSVNGRLNLKPYSIYCTSVNVALAVMWWESFYTA